MKRMNWGFFLILALVGTFALMVLFTRLKDLGNFSGTSFEEFGKFITGILTFLALASAVATIYWFHQIGLAPAQITIEPFRQALPKKMNIDKDQLSGLAMETREYVADDLKRIGERVRQITVEKGPDLYRAPFAAPPFAYKMPKIIEQEGGRLQEMAESIPSQVGLKVPLSKQLFPRPMIKVSCILLERGTSVEEGTSGRLGISFEILSTTGSHMPAIGIFFPSRDKDSHPSNAKEVVNHYKAILPDISHILAIEICKAQMLMRFQTWWYRLWRRKRWKAQVFNFIGLLYLLRAKEEPALKNEPEESPPFREMYKIFRKALEHPEHFPVALQSIRSKLWKRASYDLFTRLPPPPEDTSAEESALLPASDFYIRAIDNLQNAIRADERWHTPYVNLALMHSTRGQQIEERARSENKNISGSGAKHLFISSTMRQQIEKRVSEFRAQERAFNVKRALNLQYAARNEYQQALACLPWPVLGNEGECDERRKITIDLARVKLLIGRLLMDDSFSTNPGRPLDSATLLREAKEEIRAIESEIEREERAKDEKDAYEQGFFKINVLTDVQIPYSLACCYALAYRIDDGKEKDEDYKKTRTYLARSLARNAYILARHTVQNEKEVVIDIDALKDTISRDVSAAMKLKRNYEHVSDGKDPKLSNTSTPEDPNWYYWNRVETDIDFDDIKGELQPGKLKNALVRLLLEEPSLYPKLRKEFEERIDERLRKEFEQS